MRMANRRLIVARVFRHDVGMPLRIHGKSAINRVTVNSILSQRCFVQYRNQDQVVCQANTSIIKVVEDFRGRHEN